MAERHIGLDIGSFSVRAAEVSIDGGYPVLHRFAQITLPPGSVVEGSIVDRAAVANAIKMLWVKGEFKAKTVVVGLASRDVRVRQAEVPALGHDEVRSALRYEAQDLIPNSDVDTVMDYVVQEHLTGEDGEERLRVLVVAAPESAIEDILAVAADAGLTVEGIDLTPFALVRSLGANASPDEGEVIVCVGGGVTSVVVHAGAVPQMVRTTSGGGGNLTSALADKFSVSFERAEAIKRTASPHTPEGAAATALIQDRLEGVVREITDSIDYFLAQSSGIEISRIIVTGAGTLVPGFRERIRSQSYLPVVPADALTHVGLGKPRLTPEQLVAASTTLAAPIGLALWPLTDPATRLTALLPASYKARLRTKRQAKAVAALVCGLALLLGGLWVQRSNQVSSERKKVAGILRRERLLESQAVKYNGVVAQQAALQRKATMVTGLIANDADVSALMDQIAAEIPTDVWVQSVAINLPSKGPGTVTFTLSGSDEDAAAHWLSHMRALPNTFTSVWVPSVTKQVGVGGRITVQFPSQATLSDGVLSRRADSFKVPK